MSAFIAINDGVDSNRGDSEGFAAIRNLFNEWYPVIPARSPCQFAAERNQWEAHGQTALRIPL